jgi:nucleoside-diphosphate-sugar epimerase
MHTAPRSPAPNGHAKHTVEHLFPLYQNTHGIETVVARCFAFVAPDLLLNVHLAIGNSIRDALHAPAIRWRPSEWCNSGGPATLSGGCTGAVRG